MRSLLDLVRKNQAAARDILDPLQAVLGEARSYLKILDPLLGDQELVKSVAVELAKLLH